MKYGQPVACKWCGNSDAGPPGYQCRHCGASWEQRVAGQPEAMGNADILAEEPLEPSEPDVLEEARKSILRGDKPGKWDQKQCDYLRAIALLLLHKAEREHAADNTSFEDILGAIGLKR